MVILVFNPQSFVFNNKQYFGLWKISEKLYDSNKEVYYYTSGLSFAGIIFYIILGISLSLSIISLIISHKNNNIDIKKFKKFNVNSLSLIVGLLIISLLSITNFTMGVEDIKYPFNYNTIFCIPNDSSSSALTIWGIIFLNLFICLIVFSIFLLFSNLFTLINNNNKDNALK